MIDSLAMLCMVDWHRPIARNHARRGSMSGRPNSLFMWTVPLASGFQNGWPVAIYILSSTEVAWFIYLMPPWLPVR